MPRHFASAIAIGASAIAIGIIAILLPATTVRASDNLAAAESLLLRGNYEEAAEKFATAEPSVPAAIGRARALSERGELSDAAAILTAALNGFPASADVLCELAELDLQQGNHAAAEKSIARALEVDADHSQAHWLRAELLRLAGKNDEACDAYKWFAETYDRSGREWESPRELHTLGLGLAQHARWNRDKSRFPQLVNELYPRALDLDANFWPAHYEIGRLLAEKFNEADAAEAYSAALRINPRAAEVHAGLAQLALNQFRLDEARQHVGRALKSNPRCLAAHWVDADVAFAALRPDRAEGILDAALKFNPTEERTLGRLAAARSLQTGEAAAATGDSANRHGDFHLAAATAFDHSRRFPAASAELERALERCPQLIAAHGQRGLLLMRLGDEPAARKLLEESFDVDPYNIRVKNQLEVLDLLDGYGTIETDHFLIRYDRKKDARLARCLAHFAEDCHAEFAERFKYQLPRRAVLEVFSDGRGHTASEWFGVRMIGLPNIHTIAACGGNVVALISPTNGRSRINWADVVRHEIVHLFNIQQTNYAVPHWFTEGCAVWLEGRPRRDEWNRLLVARGKSGEFFDLENINQAFIRPRTSDDWQLAYCQAEMYVELMIREHGADAPAKLLAAFAENQSPAEAIQYAFNDTEEHFEASYQSFVADTLKQAASRRQYRPTPEIDELQSRHAANPDDLETTADLAAAQLRRGDVAEAGRLASQVVAAHADHPLACVVRAKLLVRIGDEDAAIELLEPLASADQPLPEAVELLAGLHLRRNELDAARRLYNQGAELEPHELSWTKARAAVAVKLGDDNSLAPLLAEIAAAEADNLVVRKKLLQLAASRNEASEIAQWAEEVLHINVDDGAAHHELAKALVQLKRPERAADHFEMAAQLLPNRDELNREAVELRSQK